MLTFLVPALLILWLAIDEFYSELNCRVSARWLGVWLFRLFLSMACALIIACMLGTATPSQLRTEYPDCASLSAHAKDMNVKYFQSSEGDRKNYCTRDVRTYEDPSGVLSWFAFPVGEIARYSIHIPTK
jgi:hypothetical protein